MKKNQIIDFVVEDLAFGGKALARFENQVVFVNKGLPGQKIRGKITKLKKNYAEAKLVEVLEPSPDEKSTPYQDIPGAPWAKLPLEIQQKYKQKQVFDLFKKFTNFSLDEVFDEFISSPEVWDYRNKMEYSFGPTEEIQNKTGEWEHTGFGLGSKKSGQFWLVETLEKPSGVFDEEFERHLVTLKKFCEKTGLPVYNQKTNQGFFRQLVVRKSFSENKYLINLVTHTEKAQEFPIDEFCTLIQELWGQKIGGFFWSKTDSTNDSTANFSERTLIRGEEKISEKINGLTFEISLESFFQTNPQSAEKLYEKVADYADLKPKERALDLFCGTGTIAQVLAKLVPNAQITGVEIVSSAVQDAAKNAAKNEIKNVRFACADVRKFLKEHYNKSYSTIILDPPRAGIVPKALQRVLDFSAEKIVYVSCNPATMARDTVEILKAGYTLKKMTLVDQFPHTSHVECVGKFVK